MLFKIVLIIFVFVGIAKPEFLWPFTHSASTHFETKLVRLGDDVSLACPFRNFDRFEWFKGIEGYNNQNTTIEIRNASPSDEGNHQISMIKCKESI